MSDSNCVLRDVTQYIYTLSIWRDKKKVYVRQKSLDELLLTPLVLQNKNITPLKRYYNNNKFYFIM
jgi:hypothetical protein